jgi:hypothetical protein
MRNFFRTLAPEKFDAKVAVHGDGCYAYCYNGTLILDPALIRAFRVGLNARLDAQLAKAECAKEVARMKFIRLPDPDDALYNFRTMVERVNARLKDEFGGRFVRVRGAIKVKCHLMFGILVLAVDQIFRVGAFMPASA